MPLFKIINHNAATQILVWEITETPAQLASNNPLQLASKNRLLAMKSDLHKCAFLAVRKMLQHLKISDHDLHYDPSGKPLLTSGNHISISHSYHFATLIISTKPAGIDIEMQREKIIKIANKFSIELLNTSNTVEYIKNLTIIWGAKEAIFKIKNQKGISFKDHIKVQQFQTNQNQTTAVLSFNSKTEIFTMHYHEIENYILVYTLLE